MPISPPGFDLDIRAGDFLARVVKLIVSTKTGERVATVAEIMQV
jgi:hypothetical protein